MNPHRSRSYQIQECRRLGSVIIDGTRIYSNEEIADDLGEALEWVEGVLRAYGIHDSPPAIERGHGGVGERDGDSGQSEQAVADLGHRATNFPYDAGKGLIQICDPLGPVTNMTYDTESLRPRDDDAAPGSQSAG
jgi:hypothetical protein